MTRRKKIANSIDDGGLGIVVVVVIVLVVFVAVVAGRAQPSRRKLWMLVPKNAVVAALATIKVCAALATLSIGLGERRRRVVRVLRRAAMSPPKAAQGHPKRSQ